jgi:uncharacterized membrane protein YqiK
VTGYRVITGGRALALPLLEQRSWMDVRTRPVALNVEKAYARGGTPIDVQAVATVKIATDAACVGNAIERFLQHDPEELVEVSRKTLEGHLRAMVAALTPEEVNEDRLRFAHQVTEAVQPEMGKLGLQLDTFKIIRVSDSVDYYDSLGRARLAEVLRDVPSSTRRPARWRNGWMRQRLKPGPGPNRPCRPSVRSWSAGAWRPRSCCRRRQTRKRRNAVPMGRRQRPPSASRRPLP